MFDWVGTTEVMGTVALLMSVSIIFIEWKRKREWKHKYGWYRRGVDGAITKAHYFHLGGKQEPLISFARYYSLCRRTYLDPLGNWERIEEPSPDTMCPKCMGFLGRKKK